MIVVNQCLETYFRCFTSSKPKQWHKWLNGAKFRFNTNYMSTKATPFKVSYGKDLPVLIRGDTSPTAVHKVNQLLEDRNRMLDEIKEHLCQAQN